jgi:hypothetical protein
VTLSKEVLSGGQVGRWRPPSITREWMSPTPLRLGVRPSELLSTRWIGFQKSNAISGAGWGTRVVARRGEHIDGIAPTAPNYPSRAWRRSLTRSGGAPRFGRGVRGVPIVPP